MNNSRRNTLKFLSLGACTAAVSFMSVASSLSATKNGNDKRHLAMAIDLRKCNGCRACVVSCGVENGTAPDEHRTEVVQIVSHKEYEEAKAFNLPLLCNHCEDPSCTKVCPVGATFKREEDGIVVVDSTLCVGCKYCVVACPYTGVRHVSRETSTIDKCNFCIQRTTQKLLPACVESCTGGARIFGDINDPNSALSLLLKEEDAYVLQNDKNTKPNVFYIGLTQAEAARTYSLNIENKWQR